MGAKKKAVKKPLIPLKYVLAVEEGVKFLDMMFGRKKWLRKMDMSNFDIKHSDVCVAGNVFQDAMFDGSDDGFNSFIASVNSLGEDGNKVAERFGFSSPSKKGWQYLQDLWVYKITALKRALK